MKKYRGLFIALLLAEALGLNCKERTPGYCEQESECQDPALPGYSSERSVCNTTKHMCHAPCTADRECQDSNSPSYESPSMPYCNPAAGRCYGPDQNFCDEKTSCPDGKTCNMKARMCESLTDTLPSLKCTLPATACHTDAGVYCANLQEELANCGTCGKVCETAAKCKAGKCKPCEPTAMEELKCDDREDDDCDGKIDCEDPDCINFKCDPDKPCATYSCNLAGKCEEKLLKDNVCRPAAKDPPANCEEDAKCKGDSPTCPPNPLSPTSKVCRPSGGDCDLEEKCKGDSRLCPDDAVHENGYPCRNPPAADICHGPATCNGALKQCPNVFPIDTKKNGVTCFADGYYNVIWECDNGTCCGRCGQCKRPTPPPSCCLPNGCVYS